MGRELSFRAWLESKKGFVHMQLNDKGVFLQSGGILFTTTGWEQYTGLKDKKGKEIYEGDCVRYRETIPSENERQLAVQGADFVQIDEIGVVEWDPDGASFDVVMPNDIVRGFGTRGSVEIEVIGNIHEHPHLLGENKAGKL